MKNSHKEISAKWQKIPMKSIVFSFFMLIFGTCGIFAQTTDWEKYDLKGRVKSVEATTPVYFGGCEQSMKYAQYTCVFRI